ncbi:hypothetical protein Tco_1539886 [Tanacetum coccineum]
MDLLEVRRLPKPMKSRVRITPMLVKETSPTSNVYHVFFSSFPFDMSIGVHIGNFPMANRESFLLNKIVIVKKNSSPETYSNTNVESCEDGSNKESPRHESEAQWENGTEKVYISFGAMLTDISRDDLTELCRIVMRKHGINKPEDEFEKVNKDRKYPLSAEVCKAMLDKKLQGGKPDEDCYKLLKMMEKQAGIRK